MAATARQRAHEQVRSEIVAAAGQQLATVGASELSLRAVARELGMVSSAMYRYFASRDELLTALIIEAYDSLGEAAETDVAASRGETPRARWVLAAATVRRWAVEHPHRYALLYGSPVPGYAAPDDTVVPGTRVSRALMSIVHDAVADGTLLPLPAGAADLGPETRAACAVLRTELHTEASDETLFAALNAWTQLFGLISFELFGQTRGLLVDHESFLTESATASARAVGLS